MTSEINPDSEAQEGTGAASPSPDAAAAAASSASVGLGHHSKEVLIRFIEQRFTLGPDLEAALTRISYELKYEALQVRHEHLSAETKLIEGPRESPWEWMLNMRAWVEFRNDLARLDTEIRDLTLEKEKTAHIGHIE